MLAKERQCVANFIASLVAYGTEELWRELGYRSLWDYLVRHLRLAKSSTYRRVTAVEMVQRFPRVLELLRSGQLSLRSLAKLRGVLTEENQEEVLNRAVGLSEEEAELLAVEYQPRDIPRDTCRTIQSEQGKLAPVADVSTQVPRGTLGPVREEVRPLTPTVCRLSANISPRVKQKLELAKGLLSHRVPEGDFETVLDAALDALLEKELKKNRSNIPVAVRREVYVRDEGRCTWPTADGKVCGSTKYIQFDHDLERCLGGPPTLTNVRLLCQSHNLEKAKLHLGREFMEQFLPP